MNRRDALVGMGASVGFCFLNQFGKGHQVSSKSDWPCLYGSDDGNVREQGFVFNWGKEGPPIAWKQELGTGYSQPVVVSDRLVLFHRVGDQEHLTCKDAQTGNLIWEFSRPTHYVDRYGYNGGPRSTPVVHGGRIFALGAEGKLYCVRLSDGEHIWTRDLNGDYEVEQGFFGVGSSPWLEGDSLIINVGGKKTEAGIVALRCSDGSTLWKATSDGASYATPRGATIHGKRHVFVFTESGLVDMDPTVGAVRWSIPFRSKLYESVNATSPLVVGDIVLVSATYRTGSLALKITPDGRFEELWRKPYPDSHFSNMIHSDGCVYGFAGRHENGCELFCCELRTGSIQWKAETALGRGQLLKVGKSLLCWGERGLLATIALDSNKLIPLSPPAANLQEFMKYPTWTPPAVSNGRIFLRSENMLVCCALRSR